jgi:hypothetical protein
MMAACDACDALTLFFESGNAAWGYGRSVMAVCCDCCSEVQIEITDLSKRELVCFDCASWRVHERALQALGA